MKKWQWLRRVGAGLLAVTLLFMLCACGDNTTPTTTTAGDETTTTIADDVTTTVADDVTTTEGDEPTTTVGDDRPTQGNDQPTKKPVSNKTTATKVTTTKYRPWLDATTTARPTTTEKVYSTLPVIERDPKYATSKYDVYHSLLAYTQPSTGAYSKTQILPSVGYVVDGEIKGVMYDSIIILPSPNFLYYSTAASGTKASWDGWRRHTYKNMDAINEAAKEVQEALNLKEYKIKVFPSLWMPDPTRHENWGTVNGTSLAARNDEEKMKMVEYMVDGYIAEIKEKNYSNIEVPGFYWFDESLDTNKGMWYIQLNQMVNSKDLFLVHAPYYKSKGYNYAATYGFAMNAMQSNYFHEKDIGQATTGSIKRLQANQDVLLSGVTSGITVECSDAMNHDCITAWKWTLWTVLKNGTESAYHMYYFGRGATAIYNLSRSSDPYFRSAYDELYKFFNHTLTMDEIQIDPFDKEQGIVSPDFKEYL